jgi:hypothetical protein
MSFSVEAQPHPRLALGSILRVLDENEARREAIEDAQETGKGRFLLFLFLFLL